MAVNVVYMFLLIPCSEVISDWVEIPVVSATKKANLQNFVTLGKSTTQSTPTKAIFTEVLESSMLTSKYQDLPKKKGVLLQNLPVKSRLNLNAANLTSHEKPAFSKLNGTKESLYSPNNKSKVEAVDVSYESDYIKETLEEAKKDLLNKPNKSLPEKLLYLRKMESEMSAQIRKLSQGLWVDREARGKKLLGFASMEGALMTIAFLTFAVFLVKVVHQFIQGLQNSELAMVALPTAPALRLSRYKRQERDLAAAQLLQYMDDFRIKHRQVASCNSIQCN